LYRYDPAFLALEAIIWDGINLFLGVPLLGAGVFLSWRHSLRGRLLLAGLLSHFFYVYLMYATMMAFNRLFLIYVAIFALCGVAFILNLAEIEVPELPMRLSTSFPRRVFAGYMILLAAMPVVLWMGRIVPMLASNRFPPELAGLSTLEPQALDLGLIVPLSLAGGILLWRRSAWGYFLAAVGITHGFMMFLAIPAWIAAPLLRAGAFRPLEAGPFLALCLVGLFLAALFYRNVKGKSERGGDWQSFPKRRRAPVLRAHRPARASQMRYLLLEADH
jgi:hypothetical protein